MLMMCSAGEDQKPCITDRTGWSRNKDTGQADWWWRAHSIAQEMCRWTRWSAEEGSGLSEDLQRPVHCFIWFLVRSAFNHTCLIFTAAYLYAFGNGVRIKWLQCCTRSPCSLGLHKIPWLCSGPYSQHTLKTT